MLLQLKSSVTSLCCSLCRLLRLQLEIVVIRLRVACQMTEILLILAHDALNLLLDLVELLVNSRQLLVQYFVTIIDASESKITPIPTRILHSLRCIIFHEALLIGV